MLKKRYEYVKHINYLEGIKNISKSYIDSLKLFKLE